MRKIAILGAVLIFIVLSPTYLGVSSLSQLQPSLLKVTMTQETKTIEILGKNVLTLTTTRIEEWTNGTKLRMVFYHLLNPSNSSIDSKVATSLAVSEKFLKPREYYGMNSTPPREVIITYTKWISNTTTKTEKTSRIESATIKPLTGVYYPYTDWIDGLKFVLEGEYNGVFATYDHDDNYNNDGYYPLQENTPFILQGNAKRHIHLTKDLLDSWIAGNISDALAVAASFFLYESVEELILMGLEGVSEKVAAVLSSPIVVAIMVIWDMVETIMKLLEILNLINQAQWVNDWVVEHFLGDGWAWRGPIARSEFIGWIWCPFWFKPITGWGWYQHREFDQTWGAEGIFNPEPHHYTIDWYYKTEWKIAPTSASIDGAGKYMATSPWG